MNSKYPDKQPERNDTDEFVAAAYRGYLTSSPLVDTFSSWLSAIGGGGVSLILANLDSVTHHVPISNLKWSFTMFLVALFWAAAEKYAAMKVRAGVSAVGEVNARIEEVAHKTGGKPHVDLDEFFRRLEAPFFWPWKMIVRRSAQTGSSDPLHALKLPVRVLQFQTIFAFLELVFFVLAVGTLTFALR